MKTSTVELEIAGFFDVSRFCGICPKAFQYFKEQQRRLAVESGISPEQVEVTGTQLAICKGYTPMRIWRSETSSFMVDECCRGYRYD